MSHTYRNRKCYCCMAQIPDYQCENQGGVMMVKYVGSYENGGETISDLTDTVKQWEREALKRNQSIRVSIKTNHLSDPEPLMKVLEDEGYSGVEINGKVLQGRKENLDNT